MAVESTAGGVEFDRRRLEAAAAAMRDRLAGLGINGGRGSAMLVRDTHPPRFPEPRGPEVRELSGSDEAPFAAIIAAAHGLTANDAKALAALPGSPGWRCYLASVKGEPAAVGSMFLDSDLALFALDAALEPARGDECQMALLRRRIEDAAGAGARLLCIDPPEPTGGERSPTLGNALRAGFEATQ